MNGLCKQQAWYWDKFICDLGKGSTRDRHHSPQNEEMEEYSSLARAISRSLCPGEGSEGQSMVKGFKGPVRFWLWLCDFREIILVSLWISFPTYRAGDPHLPLKWRWDIRENIFLEELKDLRSFQQLMRGPYAQQTLWNCTGCKRIRELPLKAASTAAGESSTGLRDTNMWLRNFSQVRNGRAGPNQMCMRCW